jgi:SAM-dependent methyltransferase
MSGNRYLAEFQRSNSIDLTRGIGGWLRRILDDRARKEDQVDRHALFLPRVLQLMDIKPLRQMTALEVGCASGWAISFRHHNIRYVAVDRGEVYRNELERRGVEFHEVDVETMSLPVETASIDLVILNHLIEHVVNCEFFIQELRRVIRPGGGLYIRTPNVERVKWGFFDDYTHVRPFTVNSLDQLMSAFGFGRKFLLHSDHPRIIIDLLIGGRFRNLLFSKFFGGKEIEAGYILLENE